MYLVMEVSIVQTGYVWFVNKANLKASINAHLSCLYSTAMEVTWQSTFTVSALHSAGFNIAHNCKGLTL